MPVKNSLIFNVLREGKNTYVLSYIYSHPSPLPLEMYLSEKNSWSDVNIGDERDTNEDCSVGLPFFFYEYFKLPQ